MWVRVLTVRYGIKDFNRWALGETLNSPALKSRKAWWSLGRGRSSASNIYRDKLRLLAERGDKNLFWKDLWLEERPIKDVYPRLYMVARSKHTLVETATYILAARF